MNDLASELTESMTSDQVVDLILEKPDAALHVMGRVIIIISKNVDAHGMPEITASRLDELASAEGETYVFSFMASLDDTVACLTKVTSNLPFLAGITTVAAARLHDDGAADVDSITYEGPPKARLAPTSWPEGSSLDTHRLIMVESPDGSEDGKAYTFVLLFPDMEAVVAAQRPVFVMLRCEMMRMTIVQAKRDRDEAVASAEQELALAGLLQSLAVHEEVTVEERDHRRTGVGGLMAQTQELEGEVTLEQVIEEEAKLKALEATLASKEQVLAQLDEDLKRALETSANLRR